MKKYLAITFLSFALFSLFRVSEVRAANNLLDGITCINTGICTPCEFLKIFTNASDILVGLSGVLGILMFIWGGMIMITAYGNSSRYQWGKNTLIAATVGICIIFFAWTIINTVVLALVGGGVSDSYSKLSSILKTGQGSNWSQCPGKTE